MNGILGDSGSLYTLGVQGNRPFRAGDAGRAYPSTPVAPLKILPMSQMVGNYVHSNGWPGRPKGAVRGDGTHGPGGVYTDNGKYTSPPTANVLRNGARPCVLYPNQALL